LNVISLFSGAMGLDLGLEAAGFRTRVCVESDKWCSQTIRANRPDIPVIERDIRQVTPQEALEIAELLPEQVFLVCGGPPCQPFSTAGKRQSIGDPRGSLFMDFIRFVEAIRPPYFLMENVRGILSAAIKHRPLDRRGNHDVPLEPDERLGSAINVILSEFDRIGYTVNYKLIKASDYGVPQNRERVIFLGSRDRRQIPFPHPTHSKFGGVSGNKLLPWVTLGQALEGLIDPTPQYPHYSRDRAAIFDLVPSGGNWRTLPREMQPRALGGAFISSGGKVGFYRRLSFDKPSPTILTSMIQKGSGMCHPSETRPLSVAECKRVQQFPDDWNFMGTMTQQYQQIGNAVPVGLGKVMGEAIISAASDQTPRRTNYLLGRAIQPLLFELDAV
jgi:DNA (cytosine-5)-methyltransferase 1